MESVHEAPRARTTVTSIAPTLHRGYTTVDGAAEKHKVNTAPVPGMQRPGTSHGQSCNVMRNGPCSHQSPSKPRRQRNRPASATQTPAQQVQHQQHSTSTGHSAFLRAWDQRIKSKTQRPLSAPSLTLSSMLNPQLSNQQTGSSRNLRWLPQPATSSLCNTSSRLQQQLMQRAAGLSSGTYHTIQQASSPGAATRPGASIALRGLMSASLAGATAAAVPTVLQQQQQQLPWQQPAAALSQSWQGEWRPATAGGQVHGSSTSQSSTPSAVEVHGAAAATDARMFSRWQAIRAAQHDGPAAAAVAELSWTAGMSELADEWQLLSASSSAAEVSRPMPAAAAAAGIALAHASQLLERCTVLSSKKQAEACCICLDDVAINALVPLLYCGHRMHRACLLRWLTQRLSEQPALQLEQAVVCPMCKQVSVDRRLLCSVGPG